MKGADDQDRQDALRELRRLTPARIGQGRIGGSLPTQALLDFELAHAQARDAVHSELNCEEIQRAIVEAGLGEPVLLQSQARDRREYLRQPHLGRTPDAESRERLLAVAGSRGRCALAIVIADGLSALAAERHAVPLLRELAPLTPLSGAEVRMVVAKLARVALGDEIGQLLQAQAVVVLIGERPGLSSPDSLGIYLTWAPKRGRTDAERNCISNVRPEGLPYTDAARRLAWLLEEAQRLGLSGVALKDDSHGQTGQEARNLPATSDRGRPADETLSRILPAGS